MKKYELLPNDTITHFGRTLHRIRALVSIGDTVKPGDLGGYIEKEENLSHEDAAWVSGNARVFGDAQVFGNARVFENAQVCGNARVFGDAQVSGNARVFGDAWVYGNAQVFGDSHYLVVGPVGSRGGFTTFFRTKDKDICVSCGCFRGNLDQFLEKVRKTHGDSKHSVTYRLAAELAKEHIDLSGEGTDA